MEDFKVALLYLSGRDEDRASSRNDRGFNGRDTEFGNSLAEQLQAGRRISAKQYKYGRKILQTYRKQVLKGTDIDVATLPEEMPTEASRSGSVAAMRGGKCGGCGGEFPAGEMIDLRKNADGSWSRSHAGGLCPMRLPTATVAVSPMNDNDDDLPWRDQRPRSYEEIFDVPAPETPGRVELPVVTETGLTVTQVLGPGGIISKMLPGYEHRPTQLQGAEACERALASESHAVIEAGTGTGKSLMYLTAAINSGKRTLVSTADKALQGQIWSKDIPFLQAVYATVGREVKAALLKGRANYACNLKVNELRESLMPEFKSREAGLAWAPVSEWIDSERQNGGLADLEMFPGELPGDLRSEITSDSDSCLGKRCPLYDDCFVEEAKARAEAADIVVVNHALLMRHLAIKASSGGYVAIIPDGNQIVLDEAHHLQDIATDAFGVEVTAARWNRIYNRLERLTIKAPGASKERAEQWMAEADAVSGPLDAMLQTYVERLTKSKETVQRLGDEHAIISPALTPLYALLKGMEDFTPGWLSGDEADRDQWKKATKQVEKLANDLGAAANAALDDTYVRYIELEVMRNNTTRVVVNVKPIDVSEQLRQMLFGATKTVIATSATISTGGSMDYWRACVGCDKATELEVGSPFDYPRNGLLYLPDRPTALKLDSSAARGRNGSLEYTDNLASEIEKVILATSGGVFALFTSYRMLREVYERLSPRLRDYLVLRQGDAPRGRLVEQFKAADGRAVLFGTKSFAEGVDVQGDALSVVIIDKFTFAPPGDPIWEARKAKITRETQNEWAWFERLAVPMATIVLKQAVGRLIRTQTDTGVVAVMDGRATTKGYGSKIINALPPFTQTRDMGRVAEFFGRRK